MTLVEQQVPPALMIDDIVWIGYVRAVSEAAIIGALADWFAVTALFRHPLGIPIPHTAIIPNARTTSDAASAGSSSRTS